MLINELRTFDDWQDCNAAANLMDRAVEKFRKYEELKDVAKVISGALTYNLSIDSEHLGHRLRKILTELDEGD